MNFTVFLVVIVYEFFVCLSFWGIAQVYRSVLIFTMNCPVPVVSSAYQLHTCSCSCDVLLSDCRQ